MNHVIKTISLDNHDACRIACYLDNDCLSFNFALLKDENFTCQLSDSDARQYPEDLVTLDRFLYVGTEVITLNLELEVKKLYSSSTAYNLTINYYDSQLN